MRCLAGLGWGEGTEETRRRWGGNQVIESLECLGTKIAPDLAGREAPF